MLEVGLSILLRDRGIEIKPRFQGMLRIYIKQTQIHVQNGMFLKLILIVP